MKKNYFQSIHSLYYPAAGENERLALMRMEVWQVGAFFTNIQVYTGGEEPGQARAKLIGAIRQWMTDHGYQETGENEPPDRIIAASPAGAEPWLTIYDELMGEQDGADFIVLASDLAKTAGRAAVSVLVDEIGAVNLKLFRDGELTDEFSNAPGRQETAAGYSGASGHPEAWQDLLEDKAAMASLQSAWTAKPAFAEDLLLRTAELLHWNARSSTIGYRDLGQTRIPGHTRLYFRRQTEPAAGQIREASQAVLRIASTIGRVELAADSPLRIAVGVRNTGATSTGLMVKVSGPALDQGLIYPQRVSIKSGLLGSLRELEEILADGQANQQGLVAHFPDLQLIAVPSSRGPASLSQLSRQIQALSESEFHVNVTGYGVSPGEAEMYLSFIPDGNPEGEARHVQQVSVAPRPRIPLRCSDPRDQAIAYFLGDMAKPHTMFALMVLGGEREANAAAVGEFLPRWHSLIAQDVQGYYELIVRPDLKTPAQMEMIKADSLFRGKRWPELRELLKKVAYAKLTLRRIQPSGRGTPWEALHNSSGFSIHHTSPFLERTRDEDSSATQAVFWFDLASADPEQTAKAAKSLRQLTDKVMVRTEGLQAFQANWASAPSDPGSYSTLYESACGLHGQCTAGRRWCSRFLRGVADTLWIGPDLLGRLDDPTPLERIAEVVPLSQLIRIKLRPGKSLDDLERILAPILATKRDWQEAVKRMYGRA